jgi:hypothetical protein
MLYIYCKLNIFERKVYRGILGPVYNNEKENWRILTNKEIYAMVKNPTITETIRITKNTLVWTRTDKGRKKNRLGEKKGKSYQSRCAFFVFLILVMY